MPRIGLLVLSLSYTSQTYASRLILSAQGLYDVESCFFNGCHSTDSGGSLFISDTSSTLSMKDSKFNDSITTAGCGGGSFITCSSINTYSCTYSNCYSYSYGIAIDHTSNVGVQNNLTQCSTNQCSYYGSGTSLASWMLCGGNCIVLAVNASLASSIYRESGGHFGWGPVCSTFFSSFFNCSGINVFAPNYAGSDVRTHECLVFFGNSATAAQIRIDSGIHKLVRCVFYSNSGVLESDNNGYVSYVQCVFDSSAGIANGHSTSSCMFDISNFIQAQSIVNCQISSLIFSSSLHLHQNVFSLLLFAQFLSTN